MSNPVQRVNYFDHQFLHVDDFQTEQAYHIGARQRHNRYLHTPGVAYGLRIASAGANSTAVTIGEGMALDANGNELVVLDTQTLELGTFPADHALWIVISYDSHTGRQTTETGVAGDTRVIEQPNIQAVDQASRPSGAGRVVLAQVSRKGTVVDSVDESPRTLAGSIEGDVNLTPQNPATPQSQWVTMSWSAPNRADLMGTLNVRKPLGSPEGNLNVEGSLSVGGEILWANSTLLPSQGGSIELGGRGGAGAGGTPYIDFHYGSAVQDFNARLVNDADSRLSVQGVTPSVTFRQNMLSLSGGVAGSSLSYNAHRNPANNGWVALDPAHRSVTVEMDDSPGFGRFEVWLTPTPGLGFVQRLGINGNTGDIVLWGKLTVNGDINVSNHIHWANSVISSDQGGSIELGGRYGGAGAGGVPYISFHYGTAVQGFNTRLINDADSRLTVQGATPSVTFRQNMLCLSGGTNGSSLSYNAHRSPTGDAWVPLDPAHRSVTVEMDDALGFGRFEVYLTPDPGLGWERRLSINGNTRETTVDGELIVNGGITVNDGHIIAARDMVIDAGGANDGALPNNAPAPFLTFGQLLSGEAIGSKRTAGGNQWGLDFYTNFTPRLSITNAGEILWANSVISRDQGGSIELGGRNGVAGAGGTPYIDFHYGAAVQDYNVRLINDADSQLTVAGSTRSVTFRQNMLCLSGDVGGSSFSYNAHRNPANNAWVVLDPARRAVTVEMDDAFGFGRFEVWMSPTPGVAFQRRMSINGNTGETTFDGKVNFNAGKVGYVIDQFVNNLDDALEQGDVVVFADSAPPLYYGTEKQIPIPEVDVTDQAYNNRVCGIVDAAHGTVGEAATRGGRKRKTPKLEAKVFDGTESDLDRTRVEPGQVGTFVTLGTYAYCKVDADIAPIKVGDLLTTSPTPGHAQKVLDRELAPGATIGKAMAARARGKGKIPVFVSLH